MESLIPARKPRMSDFQTSKLIGSGAFGSIYLANHKDSHQVFAMKKMDKRKLNTPKKVEWAFQERDILTFADCPFVVSMLCSFPTRSHLCMVMEYVGGGDCRTLLNTSGPLPVPLARLYFAEAVLAVEYLHSYGVVHRDLKPSNLLITSSGHIKVTDFGISKVGVMIPKSNIYKQLAGDIAREFLDDESCGTPSYLAPEVILKNGYGRPIDWWSMGIILYEFLVGFVPFYGDSRTELYKNVVSGDIVWDRYPVPPFLAQNLITKLLRKNPAHRLGTAGAFEIKGHPFLSDLDFDNLGSQKTEYVSQLVSDMDTSSSNSTSSSISSSSSFNFSDIIKHLISEHECLAFQNFISSSEWFSKLSTTATSTINDEDPKSPTECTPASSENISEMQKGSFPVCNRDDAISSLPSSSPLSGFPSHEKRKSSLYLLIEQQTSKNKEKVEKRREIPANEEIKSAINLSIEQQTSEIEEKRGKRRGSIFRRLISSCRRGLSRAARVLPCCHRSPRII